MEKPTLSRIKSRQEPKIFITRTLLIAVFVVCWEFFAKGNIEIAFYTSYPSAILLDMLAFSEDGELFRHIGITLQEAYLGLLYGSLLGIFVGVLLSQFTTLGKIIVPIISAIQGIPQLTLAPLYILWFGIGLKSKVFLSALMVFFNVFASTYHGIKNIDQKLIESASLLGASNKQILWHIVIPTSMPWIISGIRVGVSICMVGAIIGEYIGASGGLGWTITYASSFFQIERVMACITILLIIGLISSGLMESLERFVLKWRHETKLTIDSENISE